MSVDELLEAFHERSPVVVRRFQGLEPPLHFEYIREVFVISDHGGKKTYGAVVVDKVGRPCTVRLQDMAKA